jgi:hypothetical protein
LYFSLDFAIGFLIVLYRDINLLGGSTMILIKDHKQGELFDPWDFLGEKRRRMLENGWPGLFRRHILEELPVDEMRPFFHKDFGRPSKEISAALGVMLLQQAMDLTDKEAQARMAFDLQWHYALNISGESDQAKYISGKTIWTIRQIMIENNLDQVMLDKVTRKLAEVFEVDADKQRLDSVHVKSNMRKLGRVGLLARTVAKFLANLKRGHKDLFETIPEETVKRYLGPKSLQAFAMVKPSETDRSLKTLAEDLYALVEGFKDREEVRSMSSYKLMERVLSEQCVVEGGNEDSAVAVKKPKEISSDSLQNPSDPDAAYSGHKGQGYQVQVMEAFTTTEDAAEKERTLNLITHVEVERACAHDAKALPPAIEDANRAGLSPKTLLADSHYGGDENMQTAESLGVELVSPAMPGSRKDGPDLADFRYDERGTVAACPAGHAPVKAEYYGDTGRHSASFALELCAVCPLAEKCAAKPGKKYRYLRYPDKEQRLAVRRAVEKTDAFVEQYRWRAGVEATMSQYDRLTGVKRLRVRGLPNVRFCAVLKAAGLNLLRAARVMLARKRASGADFDRLLSKNGLISFVQKQIGRVFAFKNELWQESVWVADGYLKSAA